MEKRRIVNAGLLLALGLALGAAPRASYAQNSASWRDRILGMVNQARAAAGLRLLRLSPQLTAAAQNYSRYMATAGFFGHVAPDGSSPWTRIEAAGFTGATAWGENIAAGQPDPQSVMAAWLNSPGHRENILYPNFTDIGVGITIAAGSRYHTYWVLDFAGRSQSGNFPTTTSQPAAVPHTVTTPSSPRTNSDAAATTTPSTTDRPLITSLSPAIAAPNGTVALYGGGFGARPGWVISTRGLLRLLSWSDRLITIQLPAQSSGSVTLIVERPDGQRSNAVAVRVRS